MNKHQEITLVAALGMIGNILLLMAKLTVGFLTSSQAMIADGLNSAGDVFASVMTFVGNKISSKPEDHDHPYGHGKAEYIFAMIISFSLLFVAFSIFRSALNSLTIQSNLNFSPWLIIVALSTIVTKLALFLHAIRVGRKHSSLLVLANAEDHRNDVFLSTLTLVSTICSLFQIQFIDAIAGMLISFWIAFTGIRIFTQAYSVLMDTNIDDHLLAEMTSGVMKISGIDHIDQVTSKPVGLNFLLLVKVSIDANLTVYQGHEIADAIKVELMKFDHIEDVIVHVNPAQFHPQRI